jgi:hypothetical protein
MNRLNHIMREVKKAWSDSAPLTAASLLMLGVFVASVAGTVLDSRMITGVPAWLKPSKFAISTAIFCGTMAWLFRYITVWPRFMRAMGWVLAVVLVLEVAIIDVQAVRGTTSHFNVGTELDVVLFGVMGFSIGVLWLATVGVLVALFRQRFPEPAWGWWLRMGVLITVLGSADGGLMLRPTPDQSQKLRAHQPVSAVGAHTVGAPDGGPGLPGLGWSTQHGDLRIGHFFGLHGIQIVPLMGWLALRRRSRRMNDRPASFPVAAAMSYIGFVAILTWQALRGLSIVSLDSATLMALAVWATATAGILIYLFRTGSNQHSVVTRLAL